MKRLPIPEDFGLKAEKIDDTEKDWAEYALCRDKVAKTCERIVARFAAAGALVGCVMYAYFMSKEWELWRAFTLGHLFLAPFVLLVSLSCGGLFGVLAGLVIGYVPGKIVSHFTPQPRLPPDLKQRHDALEAYRVAMKDWAEHEKRRQIEFWTKMDGWSFEWEIAKLFRNRGFDAQVTKGSGDGGVDIFLRRNAELSVVQCKQHKTAVPPAVVRDLYGVLTHHNAQKAVLVSTSGFTAGAIEFARDKPIELLGIEDILTMADE